MTNEMLAIDKFICEANNFETVSYEWKLPHTEKFTTCPRFIAEVDWSCGADHMVEKWHYYTQITDCYGFFIKFYCELDNDNKEKMLQWILENRKVGYVR